MDLLVLKQISFDLTEANGLIIRDEYINHIFVNL